MDNNRQERRGGLSLSRMPGDQIMIVTPEGREILITYTENRGRRIRLRIHTDKETVIHRGEKLDELCDPTK